MEPEGELACDQLETLHSEAENIIILHLVSSNLLYSLAPLSRSLLTGAILNHSPTHLTIWNTKKLFAKLTSPVKLIHIAVHTSEIASYLPSLLQSKQ